MHNGTSEAKISKRKNSCVSVYTKIFSLFILTLFIHYPLFFFFTSLRADDSPCEAIKPLSSLRATKFCEAIQYKKAYYFKLDCHENYKFSRNDSVEMELPRRFAPRNDNEEPKDSSMTKRVALRDAKKSLII